MLVQAVMGTRYRQLTPQERDLIGLMLAEGRKLAEIGRRLGRHKSTISRELMRNGPPIRRTAYFPHKAQERAVKRRQSTHGPHRMKDERIRNYVVAKLKEKWSPELIAGRIPIAYPGLCVSHETIYRWIYTEGNEYRACLTRKHVRRRKKGLIRTPRKFNMPQRVSIDDRPENVNTRVEAGHWEVDTAFFHKCSEVMQIMTERKTRRTLLTKLKDITSLEMRAAMLKRHRYTPKRLRKSFTYDNGRENVCHVFVNKSLGTLSYFCNPGHSWEKGTVENTISLVRRFLPKDARFSEVSEQELKKIEKWLNTRPRKCLHFKTPNEVYTMERCT